MKFQSRIAIHKVRTHLLRRRWWWRGRYLKEAPSPEPLASRRQCKGQRTLALASRRRIHLSFCRKPFSAKLFIMSKIDVSTESPSSPNISICLSVCLSIYLSVCQSVYLSIYPSIYLSIYLYLSIYFFDCIHKYHFIIQNVLLDEIGSQNQATCDNNADYVRPKTNHVSTYHDNVSRFQFDLQNNHLLHAEWG